MHRGYGKWPLKDTELLLIKNLIKIVPEMSQPFSNFAALRIVHTQEYFGTLAKNDKVATYILEAILEDDDIEDLLMFFEDLPTTLNHLCLISIDLPRSRFHTIISIVFTT